MIRADALPDMRTVQDQSFGTGVQDQIAGLTIDPAPNNDQVAGQPERHPDGQGSGLFGIDELDGMRSDIRWIDRPAGCPRQDARHDQADQAELDPHGR